MSLASMPLDFNPAMSAFMVSELRASASRAALPSVTMPVEMRAKSGSADTWPAAETVTVLCIGFSSAEAAAPAANVSAAAAMRVLAARLACMARLQVEIAQLDTDFRL